MIRTIVNSILCFTVIIVTTAGCSRSTDPEGVVHDPQFVEIDLQYSFLDELNTFQGTLTKDLIMDGKVTVTFWLSRNEQESILQKAEELSFFDLPDTISGLAGVSIHPDPSPDRLRIRSTNRDKTVVWSYPVDPNIGNSSAVRELSGYIMDIVRQSATYKSLPEARGARL